MKIAAAILLDPRGRTLLVKDPGAHDGVLFSRMWQFPAIEVTRQPKAALTAHLGTTLNLPADALELEALPAARHGVTFRHIALLPFLARVHATAETTPRAYPPTRKSRKTPHFQRHTQDRRSRHGTPYPKIPPLHDRRRPRHHLGGGC